MDTGSGTREIWMEIYDVFVMLIVIFEVGRKEREEIARESSSTASVGETSEGP